MDPVHTFELIIAALFTIIALHYLGSRLHLPPAVSLIAGGAALAFIPGLPALSLDPALVLVIFLPPLLMDGAWFIPLRHLRRHLVGILSLAIGTVVFTTAVVALVTHWLLPQAPWAACAALGAIVSPPDAISARAILQRVHLPQRLSILLEGESLLNDATGLVLFRFAIAAAVTGTVVAGLICGWYQHTVFSAVIRLRGTSFWNVMIFLLEASVFLLIGSSLREVIGRVGGFGVVFDQMAVPILWIVLAMTLARFAWIFASDGVNLLLRKLGWRCTEAMGWRASTVLGWAGMRGVVTLAVALSVPANLPGRDFLLVAAFAVILITVLVQGTTLGFVIRRLRPPETGTRKAPLNMSQAESQMADAKAKAVEARAYAPDGKLIHPQLLEQYQRRARISANYTANEEELRPVLNAHFDVVLEAVVAARKELLRLHRDGQIDDRVLHELERDLDLEELAAIAAKAT